jgi:hypothetical protein
MHTNEYIFYICAYIYIFIYLLSKLRDLKRQILAVSKNKYINIGEHIGASAAIPLTGALPQC